jgi:polyisoprenoid-binding protein YceI
MKKRNIHIAAITAFFCMAFLLPATSKATAYSTKSAKSTFSVSAPAKTIFGESGTVSIQLDKETGTVRVKVPIKSFGFTNNFILDTMNNLIYSRFNEYYMESGQYPEVVYNAQITNRESINFEKDGVYPIQTKGTLRLHGVEKEITSDGTLTVENKQVTVAAKLVVLPKEFGIRIPFYIGDMYFREVFINVHGTLAK